MHPTLVSSTCPTFVPPVSKASNWDGAPQALGHHVQVSVIDLYQEHDSELQTFYDSSANGAPVSYEDLQEAHPISNSENNLAYLESLHI